MFDEELVGRLYQETEILNPQHIWLLNHMMGVSHVAGFLGRKLEQHDITIDVELLETAALIHDIGKVFDRGNQEHVIKGVKFLREKKVDEKIVRPIELHEVYSFEKDVLPEPSSWEERTLFLADLAFGQHVMLVKERVEDIIGRYSILPDRAKWLRKMSQEIYQEISEIISPESLPF